MVAFFGLMVALLFALHWDSVCANKIIAEFLARFKQGNSLGPKPHCAGRPDMLRIRSFQLEPLSTL
jgi:hypothetical protein